MVGAVRKRQMPVVGGGTGIFRDWAKTAGQAHAA